MSLTIPPTTVEGYAAVAAELHRIADALATLGPDMPQPHVAITLSNSSTAAIDDEIRKAAIDAICLAVLGELPELGQRFADGKRRYGERASRVSPLHLSIFDTVSDPTEVSEVERLRAELAEARAELAEAYHPAIRAQRRARTLPAGITETDLALAAGCDCEDCGDLIAEAACTTCTDPRPHTHTGYHGMPVHADTTTPEGV